MTHVPMKRGYLDTEKCREGLACEDTENKLSSASQGLLALEGASAADDTLISDIWPSDP